MFEFSLHVLFKYLYFAKLETNFSEIILSEQINELYAIRKALLALLYS